MATEHERQSIMTLFDYALSLVPAAAYRASMAPDSFGMEWIDQPMTRGDLRGLRHIRPEGGGYPQFAFITTVREVFAVTKESRDAEWTQVAQAQSPSRDVDHHRAGASCPGQTERIVH